MSTAQEYHSIAMTRAEAALRLRRAGKSDDARQAFTEALNFEEKAIGALSSGGSSSLTSVVLYRSAAALAKDANELLKAKAFVDAGLRLNPPEEIRKEFALIVGRNEREPRPGTHNVILNDVEIKGSIKFANEFTFDGRVEGEISSSYGVLTVGEHGEVYGEVKAKSVIVSGKVHGNITVRERCELHSHSQLIGDLQAAHLVIEEGATFVGKSEVTPGQIASTVSRSTVFSEKSDEVVRA